MFKTILILRIIFLFVVKLVCGYLLLSNPLYGVIASKRLGTVALKGDYFYTIFEIYSIFLFCMNNYVVFILENNVNV